MDVYVVSVGENGSWERIAGVSVDLTSALAIADRVQMHPGGDEWQEWYHQPAEGRWTRWTLHQPVAGMGYFRQEIVMVPLAGYDQALPWSNPEHDVMGDIRAVLHRYGRP